MRWTGVVAELLIWQAAVGLAVGPDDECDSASLLLLQTVKTSLTLGSSLSTESDGYDPLPIAGKSVYFILTDRFARSNGNGTECGFTDGFQDNNWCNGTIKGIIDHLDYIQGMGFECIWITPVVLQRPGLDGPSGYASHGYWAKDLYQVDPHYGIIEDVQELARQLHERGMCFILDIVANHMGPVHSTEDVASYYPFNETEYYHQLDIGSMTFDEYTEKSSGWPPPVQAMGPGTLCAEHSRDDCGCYEPKCGGPFDPPCPPTLTYNASSGCPLDYVDTICRAGAYACQGYNETRVHEGWFFDLGDLNQSNPFVWKQQLKWARWLKRKYMLDGLRLDTAPYMAFDFLSAFQKAAGVPILGEVTTTNMTFHASFQALPPSDGLPVLAGVLNFPLAYHASSAFCGVWMPYATWNLSTLAASMNAQLYSGLYKDLDMLGNFVDNHDDHRIAEQCTPDEASRIYNALAWLFMARGLPIMYYGTEVFMTEQRGSFWQYGWATDTLQYTFVKRLNLLRKQRGLGLAKLQVLRLQGALDQQLALMRGGPEGAIALLNNYAASHTGAVTYCLDALPGLPDRSTWVDVLAGDQVEARGSCIYARDTLPKVVIQLPKCKTGAMNPSYGFYYDIECLDRSLVGCRADGTNDACRYCGRPDLPACPA